MTESFKAWLSHEADLLEVSALFDRRGYNGLFEKEVRRLIREFPGQGRMLAPALSLDWIGYIAKSLRNAGFQDHDVDPLTHEIVVKLLISPGGLFRKWDGQPLEARFKVAVRNTILNLVQKQRSQRRFPAVSIQQDFEAGQVAAQPGSSDSEAIEEFRELVRQQIGSFALAVLDLRLRGADLKSLVGSDEFGKPTGYRVKLVVQAIKQLAQEFAQQRGDEGFLRQVRQAMIDEDQVVQRRVAGNRARKLLKGVG